MSVLVNESPECVDSLSISQDVIEQRVVDTATRLHAWSIPSPCCIHGLPLEYYCEGCGDDPEVAVALSPTIAPR
jgi:hypothetical protein